jgi:hypothetical protein
MNADAQNQRVRVWVLLNLAPSLPDGKQSLLESIVRVVGISNNAPDRANHSILDRGNQPFVLRLLIIHEVLSS